MRILKWGIIVTGVAVITAFAAGYFYLRSTLPDYNRSLTLPGVSQEVEIIRDSFGMAHIRAVDDADGYFAMGTVAYPDYPPLLWSEIISVG